MDSLHGVLRAIRKPARRDHLSVFREFLSHLDRVGRGKAGDAKTRDAKALRSDKPRSRRGQG
jgi:hypothetical protein